MTPQCVYRGVVIGAGSVARTAHLPALNTASLRQRVELAGAVDPRPGIEPLGATRMIRSLAELSTLGPIDFVDICTPPSSHVDLAHWAIEQGYHVLCEKPVAVTADEAGRLAAAARHAGRVVFPCHQYRFNPAWQKARSWLEAGRIGRWHLAEFRVYRPEPDPGANSAGSPWRGQVAQSRGGVLLDHGCHLLYLILDIAGPPQSIHAWTGRLRHRALDVEDTAQLLLEYPDRLVTMFLTWAGAGRETSIRFFGEGGVVEWVGGSLRVASGSREERVDMTTQLLKTSYPVWFTQLFERFIAALDEGSSDPALADITAVASMLERAYDAAGTLQMPERMLST
ncbi:MAG TPA: Gfo/Idh/MocA family oxidoreductase [Candidatus Dormibacteraeota bacterium]|nr:Gfo/Idh/MocA family oxidoreductase [Candidatus Dormibacteraeota bacterium]